MLAIPASRRHIRYLIKLTNRWYFFVLSSHLRRPLGIAITLRSALTAHTVYISIGPHFYFTVLRKRTCVVTIIFKVCFLYLLVMTMMIIVVVVRTAHVWFGQSREYNNQ